MLVTDLNIEWYEEATVYMYVIAIGKDWNYIPKYIHVVHFRGLQNPEFSGATQNLESLSPVQ